MKPKVSIIIPTWNRRESLREALKSILKQNYKNLEVIVIDNGSDDGTPEMIRKEFRKVKIICNEKNVGIGEAKNQGIMASTGEYLLFFDDDSEFFDRDTIKNMVEIMETHPDIGSLGGEKSIGGVYKKKMITLNGETRMIVSKGYKELEECDYIANCNCIVRKDLMLRIGGFDPKYFYLAEDKEIGYKIKKEGYRNIVDLRTTALHKISFTTRISNFYRFHKNRIRFVIINFPLYKVLLLPILDVLTFFDIKKYRDLKSGAIDSTKKYAKSNDNFLIRLISVGGSFVAGMIYGYFCNLFNIIGTLKQRFRKYKYIKLNYPIK